jgi:hypothetical protein
MAGFIGLLRSGAWLTRERMLLAPAIAYQARDGMARGFAPYEKRSSPSCGLFLCSPARFLRRRRFR